jgi:hypothetical protein
VHDAVEGHGVPIRTVAGAVPAANAGGTSAKGE